MKNKLLRLLGRIGFISYCFKHNMPHDEEYGWYGERTGCSKCQEVRKDEDNKQKPLG